MGAIDLQTAEQIAALIAASIKGLTFYPPAHPSVTQPMQKLFSLCTESLRTAPEFKMGIMDDILFLEEHLFITPSQPVAELTQLLAQKGITGLSFHRGLNLDQVSTFISLIADKALTATELELRMNGAGITHIRLEERDEDGTDEGQEGTLGTYNEALSAVRGVFRDIAKGRIPSCQKLVAVVEEMVAMTMQEPSTLVGLAMIKDYDNYTFTHSVNVGILAMALGAFMGFGREELKEVGMAGLLHDIGKTLVEKDILNKPGKLSPEEFAEMKKHSEKGERIISKMEGLPPVIGNAVLGHHIRHDRRGYPEWAREEGFGLIADILAVADSYDALTTLRVYQRPHTPKGAVDKLRELSGSALDKGIVEKFVEMMGSYPVGTLVRLDNNEIAVVFRPNPEDKEGPTVKVIMDSCGELLQEPRVQSLSEREGKRYAAIVAVLDPALRNVDVARYLS